MTFALSVVLAIVAATSFFSGIFGVAGGMILMGVLVYLLPVSQAMLVHGLAQTVSNGSRVVQWWTFIDSAIVWRFLAGAAVSVTVLAFVRFVPSKTLVLFLLGSSILVMLALPKDWAPRITNPVVAFVCGILAAALMLTAGVSGTFVDQFFIRTSLDRRIVVATKATMQTVLHAVKVVYFGSFAAYEVDETLLIVLVCVPVIAAVGSNLGGKVLERMTDQQFYWWIRRIVFCVAVYYVAESARQTFFIG
jgi:uncharacterized membrane protein YfcA